MKRFYSNVDKTFASGTTVLCIFLIQFIWFVVGDPHYKIPIWVLMLAIIIFYLIWVVTYAFYSGKKEAAYIILPEVKSINLKRNIVFIVDKSELYSIDSLVSVYYTNEDDDLETFLGIGYVQTINSNGYFQIVFYKPSEDEYAISVIKKLKNDLRTKRNLKIKPSIPRLYMEGC